MLVLCPVLFSVLHSLQLFHKRRSDVIIDLFCLFNKHNCTCHCVDLRRCLRYQDLLLLMPDNSWRGSINTTACSSGAFIQQIYKRQIIFWYTIEVNIFTYHHGNILITSCIKLSNLTNFQFYEKVFATTPKRLGTITFSLSLMLLSWAHLLFNQSV